VFLSVSVLLTEWVEIGHVLGTKKGSYLGTINKTDAFLRKQVQFVSYQQQNAYTTVAVEGQGRAHSTGTKQFGQSKMYMVTNVSLQRKRRKSREKAVLDSLPKGAVRLLLFLGSLVLLRAVIGLFTLSS
jgi:hypothetical protein